MENNENQNELYEIDGMSEKEIVNQIQQEYKYSYDFLRPKIREWLVRLQVYNNQKRDSDKVGDPLLFTVFQTIFASLYDDELAVEFLPREEGDIERGETLKNLAEFDQEQMQKARADFEWIWDTLFFGKGLLLFQEFNRKKMHPVPQVLDPMTFLRDPRAVSINGDLKGNGSARFFGREISETKYNLEKNTAYFGLDELKTGKELTDLLREASAQRKNAQGLGNAQVFSGEENLKGNAQYDLLEWWTHINGIKYLLTLGNNKTKLIRATKMKDDFWPVLDRALFPIAHDWDGVSVPDLVEDKQRARAILQNLGLAAAKSDVYPMYLFDETRVKNRQHLNFGFNKFIPIKGDPSSSVVPMNKAGVHNTASWIMDILDQSAQRALATPEIQQGIVGKKQRTLGELELVSAKVDTRYSLAAKIFGWSEKSFWRQWYWLYKTYFKASIDKKVMRLTGIWGAEFKKLSPKDLIMKVDPDIKIESKIMAEAKRIRERNDFVSYLGVVLQEPDINRRFALKKMAKLNAMPQQEIKMLFPPILDEIDAEEENDLIQKKQNPKVEIREDHLAHIQIHSRLQATKTRENHIEAHRQALKLKRKNLKLFREREAMQKPKLETNELKAKAPTRAEAAK